jgi:hypothetical protein
MLLSSKKTAIAKLALMQEVYVEYKGLKENIQTLASERGALLEADGSGQCVCCWDRASTVALRPCGHVCVCDECSGNTQSCPLCRTKVSAVMRIFFSEHSALLPSLPSNFLRTERKQVGELSKRDVGGGGGRGGSGEGGRGGRANESGSSLALSPSAAAALLENLKQAVSLAEEQRCSIDASLPCGQCVCVCVCVCVWHTESLTCAF